MNGTISSSILLSIIRVIGISIQAGTILYLTHRLNIIDMGYFSLVYSFLGIIRFLGPLGTDQLVMRQISKEKKRWLFYSSIKNIHIFNNYNIFSKYYYINNHFNIT